MKNRIYFFTGTGNSLRAAEKIGKHLEDCEIIPITEKTEPHIPSGCQRIGFIFPVYFQGMPKMVAEFIEHASFPKQKDTYFFAVATYGALHGNAIPQMGRLLSEKGIHLNYNKNLRMFSNYVVMYDMSQKVQEITEKSEQDMDGFLTEIVAKMENKTAGFIPVLSWYYKKQIARVNRADNHFSVSGDCISCGKCAALCPSGNIKMVDGHPQFQHRCNQCVACIQYCPKRAINYKKTTQTRRRYTQPDIGYRELAKYYK